MLVIIAGAGWNTDDITKDFSNLSVLKLPPYSQGQLNRAGMVMVKTPLIGK